MTLNQHKIAVVLPAYNAAKTLERTYREIPTEIVDYVLLVDDASSDDTVRIAERLGLTVFTHPKNQGYGANQKTCYSEALKLDADIFVMLHPDYQYSPKLIPAMASMIISQHYDVVLGSRILGGTARAGGMPVYKYAANRFLTLIENWITAAKLSEYHTGYRAYSRKVLEKIPFNNNSDDFVFDNQLIVQALYYGFKIGEISCPTKYFPEASSITFSRSLKYGFGVLLSTVLYRLAKSGIYRASFFRG